MLRVAGCPLDDQSNLIEGLQDIEPLLLHRFNERPGIWAVSVIAIQGDVPGLGCIREECAFGRTDLGQAAVGSTKTSSGERVIPASIQNDKIKLGAGSLHLPKHQRHVDHLKVDVRLAGGIGGDWNEVICPAKLKSVAGIIEEGNVRAHQLVTKALDHRIEPRFVEVYLRSATYQAEA